MSAFIHLPLKSTATTDWTEPLSNFITNTYGSSTTADLTQSISQLNKLRLDIQHSTIKDHSIIPLYYNYYSQLDSLELRLPVHSFSKLEFTWHDAFDSSLTATQHAIAFEKASILFNLASVLSYSGAVSTSELDWKSSVDQFQRTSGILEFISSNFLHAPTNDLKVDTVRGLSKLMLAQAQECFLLNYLQSTSEIKHSLVSKLSQSCSSQFKTSGELLSESSNLDCKDEINAKFHYYNVFALFHNAQNYADSTKFGFALACLKQCEVAGYNAKKSIKPNNDELLQMLDELMDEVKKTLETYDKDNDFIYHQVIPATNNVPAVKGLDSCKFVPLTNQLENAKAKDMFSIIVPMETHEKLSIYTEKQAQLIRQEQERVDVSDEEVKSTLEFLKLPQSIRDINNLLQPQNDVQLEEEREKEEDYPRVLAMAHEVSYSITPDLQIISTIHNDIISKLNECDESFARDEKNLNIGRVHDHSEELEKLKDEVSSVRKGLFNASSSDKKLGIMFEESKEAIEVLKTGTDGLIAWLNNNNDDSNNVDEVVKQVSLLDLDDFGSNDEKENSKVKKEILVVNSKVKELEYLMKERCNTLADLKNALHNDDISAILVQNRGKSDDELQVIFEEQLNKFSDYTNRLDHLISSQPHMINDLKDSMSSVLDSHLVQKKLKEKEKERGTVRGKLRTLVSAYNTWKVYVKGVTEAKTFYEGLRSAVVNLRDRIDSLVLQRETQNSFNGVGRSINSFGGYSVNNYNNQNSGGSGKSGSAPPLPNKPGSSGDIYSTPSTYNPGMYSQFGNQNWN